MKTLDQSYFQGLPAQYRWLAVDKDGSANAFGSEPVCDSAEWFPSESGSKVIPLAEGKPRMFSATGWQHSVVLRDSGKREYEPLASEMTLRQHVAFELLKGALADMPPRVSREDLGLLVSGAWQLADAFLEAGKK